VQANITHNASDLFIFKVENGCISYNGAERVNVVVALFSN